MILLALQWILFFQFILFSIFVSTRFFWELFTNLSFHAKCIGEAQQFFYKNINKKLKKKWQPDKWLPNCGSSTDSLESNFHLLEVFPLGCPWNRLRQAIDQKIQRKKIAMFYEWCVGSSLFLHCIPVPHLTTMVSYVLTIH